MAQRAWLAHPTALLDKPAVAPGARLQTISWTTQIMARMHILDLAQHWEIDSLVALERGGQCWNDRKYSVCETCVTVYGVKQDLWEVNYALWGMAIAALDWPEATAGILALAYKTRKAIIEGEPNKCKPTWQFTDTLRIWMRLGHGMYAGNLFWTNASAEFQNRRPKTDNERFTDCGKCNETANGPFHYHLSNDLGGG
jgi:hypothetical protein